MDPSTEPFSIHIVSPPFSKDILPYIDFFFRHNGNKKPQLGNKPCQTGRHDLHRREADESLPHCPGLPHPTGEKSLPTATRTSLRTSRSYQRFISQRQRIPHQEGPLWQSGSSIRDRAICGPKDLVHSKRKARRRRISKITSDKAHGQEAASPDPQRSSPGRSQVGSKERSTTKTLPSTAPDCYQHQSHSETNQRKNATLLSKTPKPQNPKTPSSNGTTFY